MQVEIKQMQNGKVFFSDGLNWSWIEIYIKVLSIVDRKLKKRRNFLLKTLASPLKDYRRWLPVMAYYSRRLS